MADSQVGGNMAKVSREARYVPALSGLLILTIGVAVWWLFNLDLRPPKQPSPSSSYAAILLTANSASMQARQAIYGDQNAFADLELTASALNETKETGLSKEQTESLGEIRNAVATILDGRGDIVALQTAVTKLNEQAPKFADSIYALQGAVAIQRQPLIVAQLERLRLLGESLPVMAQGLLSGAPDIERQMVDAEMNLQQIVRALQAGDPALGIPAASGAETEQAIAGVARRAKLISEISKEVLQIAERIPVIRDAGFRLDGLVAGLDRTAAGESTVAPALSPDLSAELTRIYALLGCSLLVVIALVLIWFRTSGRGATASEPAGQSDSDQEAILRLLDELGNLADGDLTVQATVSEDITGAIADSINYAIEAMRDLVATINKGAVLVEDATKQTAASAKALEEASEAQSRQVKAATESVHQMAASIDEISSDAERSSDVARYSVDVAHKGGDAVRRTIEGMNTIRETIQDTSKRIKRLGESSQEIGDIVELINDIADQTNILALNASIQASMAGEAGRGFAVVADEVQRLAERSTNATKQIEVLVSTIQSDTNEAVVSMERSTTDVVGGALLAENAGAALEEIEQVSNQIANLVQNISGSAREQTKSAKAVLEIVQKLNEISAETDASASTTANFISKLSALASQLRESVSGFILPEENNIAEKANAKDTADSGAGQSGARAATKPATDVLAGQDSA